MALVEVKPIERVTWHGKGGKDSFARPIVLEALVDSNSGKFAVNISEERLAEITKNTNYNLSLEYIPGKPHEFWAAPTGRVKLDHKTSIFDTKRPLDEIRIGILKGSFMVANSMKEFEDGLWPHARFVIFNEEEEIEAQATKSAQKRKVYLKVVKLVKSRKLELIQIFLGVNAKNQSEDFIDFKVEQILDKEDLGAVSRFLDTDKKRTAVNAIILEALQKNVLRKDGPSILYMDDSLGYDTESAIDYLLDDANQSLKAIILAKIN